MHKFKTEQFLPIPLSQAWDFFSSPYNLELITPPDMDFKILTALNNEPIYNGMILDYTVRPLWGLKMYWQTEIHKVENQSYFIDKQVKGPYQFWEHQHLFKKTKNGVLVTDIIQYQLPFGKLGVFLEKKIVKKRIHDIFNYRREILQNLFT